MVLSIWLPFWSVSLAAFLVALIFNNKLVVSFWAGFLGISLLWAITTLILGAINNYIILTRVASIFNLSSFLMVLVIFLTGGLLGGFAAATASQLKLIFKKERPGWKPSYR